MIRLPLPDWLLATAMAGVSSAALADDQRYEWPAVPGAAYYQGSIKNAHGESAFKTTSNWLILPEGSTVTMEAFGANNASLTPLRIKSGSPDLTGQPLPVAPPPPPPAKEKAPMAAKKPKAPPRPRTLASRARASLSIGIGKEWLTSTGGISTYKGTANIGGTIVRAESGTGKSPWYASGMLSAHDFSTVTEEQTTTGNQTGKSESKLLRLAVRAGGFYDFAAAPAANHRLALGAGLAYLRMPTLVVSNQTTGAAALQDQSAPGAFVALAYECNVTAQDSDGVELALVPLTFGAAKISSTEAYAYWRHAFVQTLYTEFGVEAAKVQVKRDAGCPSVDGCKQAGTAASSLLQARMGLGLRF